MILYGQHLAVYQLADAQRKLGIISGALLAGGAAGTVLTKASGTDYDFIWGPSPLPAAGNGIAVVGNVVHFAQVAAYAAGAIPFATGAATMGFDAANLFWDNTDKYLGIGIAAPTDSLHIVRTFADGAVHYPINLLATTSASGGPFIGVSLATRTTGAANFNVGGRISGGVISGMHNGSGVVTSSRIFGLEVYHGKDSLGTGAADSSYGLFLQAVNLNAIGAITTAYSLAIQAPITTGAITNHRAINIADSGATEPVADGVSTRVGIYQAGLWDANFFGGNISVGAAAFHRNDIVRCEKTFSSTAHSTGVAAILTLNPSGTHTEWNAALSGQISTTGAQNFTNGVDSLVGVIGTATHAGTGTCAGAMGGRFFAVKDNTGAVTTLTGVAIAIYNQNVTGAVTTGYGLWVGTPTITGAITTNYQAYLAAGAGGTSYGLYQAGASDFNFLAGNTSIGTVVTAVNVLLRIERNLAVTTTAYGIYSLVQNTPGADTANVFRGAYLIARVAGANNYTLAVDSVIGVQGQALHNGTGTVAGITGLLGTVNKQTTGPITAAYGVRSQVSNDNVTNAITAGYGFFGQTPIVTGAITTYYGLYLSAGAGTTIYGIAQAGTSDLNYLAGFSAFGSATPVNTAFTLFGASTASITSLRVPRGTAAYAGSVEGDFWNDFTQQCFIGHIDGLKQYDARVSFVATADATVNNTNAETSLIGAGLGTLTFPANFFVVGKTVRVTLRGRHTTDATPPAITFRVKLGGVTFASVAFTDLTDTDQYIEIDFLLTCRTTGAGGTAIGQGGIWMHQSTAVVSADFQQLVMTAAAALDTTAARTLEVTAQPTVADVGSTITITNVVVQIGA